MNYWWNDYVGIPYKEKGRAKEGSDCWGLVRLVYQEQFNIALPTLLDDYETENKDSIAELVSITKEGWEQIAVPSVGDVVVFNIIGQPVHVGIVTSPGMFLHVRRDQDAVIERLTTGVWKHRIVGYYKYKEKKDSAISFGGMVHPLRADRIDGLVPEGLSISQIVNFLAENNNLNSKFDAHIMLDGQIIPKAQWELVIPKQGSRLEYRAIAGDDQTARIIGTIIIAFVAFYVPGALGLTNQFAIFATQVGINIAGAYLLNSIFPIRPTPSIDTSIKQQNLLQGGSNQANQYGAIPVVLGQYRYTPPLGAVNYVEATASQSFLRMLLVWGYGKLQVSDFRIGDVALNTLEQVEYETLNDYNGTVDSNSKFKSIYGKDVSQEFVQIKLEAVEKNVSSASRTANIFTINTIGNHGMLTGWAVRYVAGGETLGRGTITYVDSDTFTFQSNGENITLPLNVTKPYINSYGIATITYGAGQPFSVYDYVNLTGGITGRFRVLYATPTTFQIYTALGSSSGNVNIILDAGYVIASPWTEKVISDPCDKLTVSLHFPEGLRSVPTEGGNAGKTASALFRAMIQVRQLDPNTLAPISDWGDIEKTIKSIVLNFDTARFNTDSDNDLESVYRWSRITVDSKSKIIVRTGAFTTNVNSDPSGNLLTRLQENSFGFNNVYTRLPDIPAGEEELYQVCIYGNSVYRILDMRGFQGLTYTITSNVCTVFYTGHPYVTDRYVTLDFRSGSGIDGTYKIKSTTLNSFDIDLTAANTTQLEAVNITGTLFVDGCNLTMNNLVGTIASGTIVRAQQDSISYGASSESYYKRKNAFSTNISFDVPNGPQEVRVRRTNDSTKDYSTDAGNKAIRFHDCFFVSVTGFEDIRPVIPPKNLVMTAIKVKATNQLNGQVDGISGIITSVCKDYDTASAKTYSVNGSNVCTVTYNGHPYVVGNSVVLDCTSGNGIDGTYTITEANDTTFKVSMTVATTSGSVTVSSHPTNWVTKPTRNPASLFRYVLQHPANAQAVADAAIDLPSLIDWHAYCKTNSFMFDAVIADQKSLLEVLRDVCAAGRASPTIRDGKWTVVIDRPTATISQFFTPSNSWGFESSKALPVIPHAFRVQFTNSKKGYIQDEMIVYNDGYTSANATKFEGLSLPGVTTTDQIFKHARFHLAQLKLRPEKYTLNVDMEHLISTRGDRVKVTHDVPLWGLATGRIKNRNSGTELELDNLVPMDASTQYTIRIRLANGTSVTRTVAAKLTDGYYSTITLTSSVTTLQGAAGNLFMFGALNAESVDLVIQTIEPTDNYSARITLVDYAEAIYSSDDEVIPPFDSNITLPPIIEQSVVKVKPTIQNITSDESVIVVIAPGQFQYRIKVAFNNVTGIPKACKYVEGQIVSADDSGDEWEGTVSVSINSSAIYFNDVEESEYYKMRLRYVTTDGRVGPWQNTVSHQVVGKKNKPADVTGLTASESGNKIKLDWLPNSEPDLNGYEIRTTNTGWGNTTPLWKGDASEYVYTVKPAGTYTWYVKAKDVIKNYSVNAASVSFTILKPGNVTAVTQKVVKVATTYVELSLEWDDVSPTTFDVAGYEIRTTNTTNEWGTSSGYKYKGRASSALLTKISASTSTTFYIRTYDVCGNYSNTSFSFVHDVTAPGTMDGSTVNMNRVVSNLVLTIQSVPQKPPDFDVYEWRIGKVTVPGIPDGTTDNFWTDPDVQILETTISTARIDIKSFTGTKVSTSGIKYRVAVRMRDKSGNYSAASALGSTTVTKIT